MWDQVIRAQEGLISLSLTKMHRPPVAATKRRDGGKADTLPGSNGVVYDQADDMLAVRSGSVTTADVSACGGQAMWRVGFSLLKFGEGAAPISAA
ncbi:hypothetical protein KTAU_38890 [Thermogemmatispora aurantia]|uniref:Uncharacterized protein n=1 Tax=Thermogemmatispora aurantia TaxID=2045279 RepID=A0A5J4K9H9_9CHLR|nr:hypothetical protein KTAU_38890 [Thermogemmatispora aurantia]